MLNIMRKTTLLLAFMLAVTTLSINAQENKFSLGVNFLGSQLSGNIKFNETTSLRADLDFTFIDYNTISITPVLLLHQPDKALDLGGSGNLVPYHGFGIGFTRDFEFENTTISLRYLYGATYEINDAPIELFMDAGPRFDLDENSSLFYVSSSLGVRYRF